ncbi:Bromodomain-containing protein 2 [Seminavis robusta]|uniref:Bromodomain-containing protein 2 n=1 Tax=Seminavis robusta TaxID=568900 RepID=A0A9N8HNK5_9STRA|nr:Bromodomain-containing protein 2 [Seminavis robusta]|eukprot:Sro1224_g253970.1 Bromodomain-containing protein 2 (1426) ;mRNA; f:10314-14729
MLESERSLASNEDEKTLTTTPTASIKEESSSSSKETEHPRVTPSLSSSSPSKKGEKEDEDVNNTTTNKTTNGVHSKTNGSSSSSAMDTTPVKKEEDVEMEDAEETKKTNKNNTNSSNDTSTKDNNKTATPKSPKQQQQQQSTDEEKKTDDKAKAGAAANGTNSNSKTAAAPPASSNPPPPVLKGTLSYNLDLRRHMIRGMWNYENSNAFPPQRFELVRTLDKEEDPKELPKDGEFHGSFSLAYFHTTSKGKQKERSKVITEHGVKITFTKIEGVEDEFKVDGKGTNQFGIFHINGTAKPSMHDGTPEYNIVLRKRYEPSQQPAAGSEEKSSKKRKNMDENAGQDSANAPLPPPSKSYPSGVVCLRGTLKKDGSEDLGATDVVHRINGMWSSGLDLILADPQNVGGLCNRFEYEHKSAVPNSAFPVSGRYSGWFHLNTPEGKRTTITEKDVNLRFIKNNAGYHNVEGRGFNVFGKYTISGTLSMENVITIFRHFKAIKQKTKTPPVTSAPPPINKGGQSAASRKQHAFPEPRLMMDEVKVPGDDNGEVLPPITPPENTTYSAVSQGVLRMNDDGSHQCTGKWAVTREHFNGGQTSPFNFRLEPHFALEAVNDKKRKEGIKVEENTTGAPVVPQEFPLDSALYKGSFHLKKKGNRYDTVVDQQIVMKFRKSTSGAYNVYGRGVNGIGVFNLIGTLIMVGKTSGRVELYRIYLPELLTTKKAATDTVAPAAGGPHGGKGLVFPKPAAATEVAPLPDASIPKAQLVPSTSTILPGPPRGGLARRESTRLVKLPSRLEDDDPKAQLARIMEKCVVILRHIRDKDGALGAFFKDPVDPIALGIPTYTQVISEPMDLGTVGRRLEASQIDTPEEFARLVRLTFENAITFNVDPNHSVHVAARNLLVEFNKKFRDIERILETIRKTHKPTDLLDEKGKKKKPGKDDKKRKRSDEPKSLKRRRLEEAQAMSAANANAMAAIVAAAPTGVPNAAVSRGEFNMMIHMIQLLQKQIVQTHNAVAELSPGDETDNAAPTEGIAAPAFDAVASLVGPAPAAAKGSAPERKKPKKKAAEPVKKAPAPAPSPPPPPAPAPAPVYEEAKPLTLQEQETLTETINNMSGDHISGVIQIIRESMMIGDEDEIDLEIDQLDAVTQRKLLRHVSKFIKPKGAKRKTTKKSKGAAPAPAPAPPPPPKPIPKKSDKLPPKKPQSPKKSDPGSFFAAFGSKDDSDSDSDDDEPAKQTAATTPTGKQLSAAASSKSDGGFDLGDSFTGLHDEDNDDDLGSGGLAMNWNISKAVTEKEEKDKGGDDDDWGAARGAKAKKDAQDADRRKREEKQKLEAEKAKEERLAEAAAKSAKLKAKREEEAEEEKKRQAEKEKAEKEEAEATRAKMREQVGAVEQTVDLDAQRDLMKQYEQSFLDKDLGGGSPSSDFGF